MSMQIERDVRRGRLPVSVVIRRDAALGPDQEATYGLHMRVMGVLVKIWEGPLSSLKAMAKRVWRGVVRLPGRLRGLFRRDSSGGRGQAVTTTGFDV